MLVPLWTIITFCTLWAWRSYGVQSYEYTTSIDRRCSQFFEGPVLFSPLEISNLNILSSPTMANIPSPCRRGIEKYLCSRTYVVANFSTSVLSRPCESICSYPSRNCSNYASLFGISLNCSSSIAIHSRGIEFEGSLFDSSNNCGILNYSNQSIENGNYPRSYSYHGVCSSLFKNIYVPPLLDPEQYVWNGERSVNNTLSLIPDWTKESCYRSLLGYACSSVYEEAVNTSSLVFLSKYHLSSLAVNISSELLTVLHSPIVIPRKIGSYAITDYLSQCDKFIERYGFSLFNTSFLSSNDSVLNPFSIVLNNVVYPLYETYPRSSYSSNLSVVTFSTWCPDRFVIPDDPNDPGVVWVDGTGCALGCRSPIWSPTQWKIITNILLYVSIFGCVFLSTSYFIWITDSRCRRQYLLHSFAFFTFMSAVLFIITSQNDDMNNKYFCKSNAVKAQRVTSFESICMLQSLFNLYSGLGCAFAWCIHSFDMFMRVVRRNNLSKYWKIHLFIVFILPLAPVFLCLEKKLYGFGGVLPWCSFSTKFSSLFDLYVFYLPAFTCIIIGLFSMVGVFRTAVLVSRNRKRISIETETSITTTAINISSSALRWADRSARMIGGDLDIVDGYTSRDLQKEITPVVALQPSTTIASSMSGSSKCTSSPGVSHSNIPVSNFSSRNNLEIRDALSNRPSRTNLDNLEANVEVSSNIDPSALSSQDSKVSFFGDQPIPLVGMLKKKPNNNLLVNGGFFQQLRLYQRPVIFVFYFVILWFCLFAGRLSQYSSYERNAQRMSNWIDCIFDKQIHQGHEYVSSCGENFLSLRFYYMLLVAVILVSMQTFVTGYVIYFNDYTSKTMFKIISDIIKWLKGIQSQLENARDYVKLRMFGTNSSVEAVYCSSMEKSNVTESRRFNPSGLSDIPSTVG